MGPTLILSDLHLGRPDRGTPRVDALRPLWRDATRLIVNGDLADVHHPRFRADAARAVLKLADACEHDGVELTVLSGNHDPLLSDLRHLELVGGRVLVTHGDAVHPSIAPWSPAGARLRVAYDEALSRLDVDERRDLAARLNACQYASQVEWEHAETVERETHERISSYLLHHPWMIAKVLWYWRVFPGLAARFAADHAPHARIVIIGHTHRAGIWTRGPRTIVNTGSFSFPGRPHAVAIGSDTLTLRRIVRRGDVYGYATSSRSLPLPRASTSASVPDASAASSAA